MTVAGEGGYGRHLLMRVDATGYGASDDLRQGDMQRALAETLDEAAARAGLDRATWERQPAGDGELAVLPDREPEARVVDDYVRALAHVLARLNRRAPAGERLRLRLAIHHGLVSVGRLGFPGHGPVEVSRMVDGEPVRLALRRSDAELVVALSDVVYRDTVVQPHTTLRPEQFRQVFVRHKEFARDVWLLVPGHDVHALDLRPEVAPAAPAGEPPAGPPAATTYTFHGPIIGDRPNFGIVYGS